MSASNDYESTNNGNVGGQALRSPANVTLMVLGMLSASRCLPQHSFRFDEIRSRGSTRFHAPEFNKLLTFHATTMGTEVLVLEGTVAELPPVHAKAKRDQQDVPFLTSGMKGI